MSCDLEHWIYTKSCRKVTTFAEANAECVDDDGLWYTQNIVLDYFSDKHARTALDLVCQR